MQLGYGFGGLHQHARYMCFVNYCQSAATTLSIISYTTLHVPHEVYYARVICTTVYGILYMYHTRYTMHALYSSLQLRTLITPVRSVCTMCQTHSYLSMQTKAFAGILACLLTTSVQHLLGF